MENLRLGVGSILKSKKEGENPYLKVDDFYGDLLFVDNKTGKKYKLNNIKLGSPRSGAPDFVEYSVYISVKPEDCIKD